MRQRRSARSLSACPLGSGNPKVNPNVNQVLVRPLDELITEFEQFRARSQHDDCSDVIDATKAVEMITRSRAAIERLTGRKSPYQRQADEILAGKAYEQFKLVRLTGVLRSLKADINAGYLKTFEELIHADLFADFLEMAAHLLDNGYKDAAAVLTGSTLEAHLRQLAKRVGFDLEMTTSKGVRPKAADQLNAELVKAAVYSNLDQKSITAWLDLRNKAAHGQYDDYKKEQVSVMIAGVRDFMARTPA